MHDHISKFLSHLNILGHFVEWHISKAYFKQRFGRLCVHLKFLIICEISQIVLKMGHPRPLFRLFLIFSNKHQYNVYNKLMRKNVHPAFGAGIRTHDIPNLSLLPQPLYQGYSRALSALFLYFQYSWKLPHFTFN